MRRGVRTCEDVWVSTSPLALPVKVGVFFTLPFRAFRGVPYRTLVLHFNRVFQRFPKAEMWRAKQLQLAGERWGGVRRRLYDHHAPPDPSPSQWKSLFFTHPVRGIFGIPYFSHIHKKCRHFTCVALKVSTDGYCWVDYVAGLPHLVLTKITIFQNMVSTTWRASWL